MPLDALTNRLPDYAKDLKLNLSSLLRETLLTDQQKVGCFLACAFATRHAETIETFFDAFAARLAPAALRAVRAAAAIMGMNNIYYRFLHLASNRDYQTLPAGLRMSVIARPGVEKVDFELWCLAVSAINGCGVCVDSHERILRDSGFSLEQVQAAIRIAATVHAVAGVLAAEEAAPSLA